MDTTEKRSRTPRETCPGSTSANSRMTGRASRHGLRLTIRGIGERQHGIGERMAADGCQRMARPIRKRLSLSRLRPPALADHRGPGDGALVRQRHRQRPQAAADVAGMSDD